MPLIQRLWLLLLAVAGVATAGSLVVNLLGSRMLLQNQLQQKNNDSAQLLAQVLSQQRGDATMMQLVLRGQHDTGHYRVLRLIATDGRVLFAQAGEPDAGSAPAWFRRAFALDDASGWAQVSDGWRAIGRLEVASHGHWALDALWRAGLQHAAWMAALAAGSLMLAMVAVRRLQRPLDATVQQAQALVDGRYVLVDEPAQPELRRVARAMNSMVMRVRTLFEAQSMQVETLRRQAHCDPLTGLSHRACFMSQLGAALGREDGLPGGALVLVRVAALSALNLHAGREAADRVLLVVAQVLQAYPARVAQCLAGRLNGADFALCLPAEGVAAETADSIAVALAAGLPAIAPTARAHVGAVEFRHGVSLHDLLARADLALARAEHRGPFGVEVLAGSGAPALGEGEWRHRIESALADGRAILAEFPLVDARGALLHLECPLRLQLAPGGPMEPAAVWLPMAERCRLMAAADLHALETALRAATADGLPRALNFAAASLAEGTFVSRVLERLGDRPQAAALLSIEWPEAVAVDQFDLLQRVAAQWRPRGVRIGIEHAGMQLHRIERLFELGLDYAKLDASVCAGVHASDTGREVVRNTVALLHALSIRVHAEGVASGADARALFDAGVDGVTGPWVRGA